MPPAPDSPLDDAALVARVASGDHAAFRVLVQRHQGVVLQVAHRYLGRRADAEDVAQETFLRLYSAAPRYRPTASFRTYLLTITTRLCLNRRAKRDFSWEDVPERASEAASAQESLELQERARAVARALAALPDDQRLATVLLRFSELDYAQVAEVMGRSVSSVTSLVWRAREHLRRSLAHLEEPPPAREMPRQIRD